MRAAAVRAATIQAAAVRAATLWIAAAVLILGCSSGDDREQDATTRPTLELSTALPIPTTAPVDMPAAGAEDPIDAGRPTPTPTPQWWVDPSSVGENFGEVDGLLTFRGNPTRTFYGRGPVPRDPAVDWRFGEPDELCSFSTVGAETTKWCGTGWTGQPAIFEREGRRWVVFGSYRPAVHFLDAATGERILADLEVGDLIKGSVTIDPDGYPLVYFGSRDGLFRVVAFDGPSPRELWQLSADSVEPTLWNDDWDGVALVVDDYLFVGGENSNLHIVRLHRGYDDDGAVQVEPELVFHAPGWDDELLNDLGDSNVSIETAITIVGNSLWFANSGGLVQAWDIGGLRDGVPPERVFRFWTGDDTDASVVVDDEGFAYVGVEIERALWHGVQLGQLIKLDPTKPDDPVVWSRDLHVRVPDGIWATPAIHRDVLYVPTNEGNLHAIDRETGATRWQTKLQGPVWSSPVVVDDVLIQAACDGTIHAWDVAETDRDPIELWTITLPWCVESTPAVWGGQIIVGHRRGEVWAIGEAG
ncbi:MAG: PQQ-binding-like beta-propeller repeat protein [Actinomycetota bacterium]